MSPGQTAAILIRGFEASDADAVSWVIGETLRRSNSVDYSPEVLQPLIAYFSAKKVRQLALERRCLVAELDGQVVGTISLDAEELCTFFVHPDHQNRGIGTRLLAALEELTLVAGIKTIRVGSSVTALRFYVAKGFEETGVEIEGAAGKQIGMKKELADGDLFRHRRGTDV